MFRSHLLAGLRHLLRYRGFAALNVAGLTVALACSLLIGLWLQFELSFDRFHKDADRLQLVARTQRYGDGQSVPHAVTAAPVAGIIKEYFPEAEAVCRYDREGDWLLEYEDEVVRDKQLAFADQSFLDMFSFPWLAGNASQALTEPYSIVLTTSMAAKLFGSSDPVGKVIKLDRTVDFTVTGVLDVPENSTLQFSCLVPFDYTAELGISQDMGYNFAYTFVRLAPGVSLEEVNAKIRRFMTENAPETTDMIFLHPFLDLHLRSQVGAVGRSGDIDYVYIFAVVALAVVVIAVINYVNLTTARLVTRAHEVGARKALGAGRMSVAAQFLCESCMLAVMSIALALVAVEVTLPWFHAVTGSDLSSAVLHRPVVLTALFGAAVCLGLVAGVAPAVALSAPRPVDVLRTSFRGSRAGSLLRRALVVGQFTAALVLVVGAIVVARQVSFMKTAPGFRTKGVLCIPIPDAGDERVGVFTGELEKRSDVDAITAVSNLPTGGAAFTTDGVRWPGKDPDLKQMIAGVAVDRRFVEAFGIKVVAGRPFASSGGSDSGFVFMINEAAARMMNLDDPVGANLYLMSGVEGPIVGIVEDYHFQSFRHRVEPLVLLEWPGFFSHLCIVYNDADPTDILVHAQSLWENLMGGYPFSYTFLDDEFDRLYGSELRLGGIVRAFAFLAVFVSCLGLFGLVASAAERRTREIGLRKVLGASTASIVALLGRESLVLVAGASLVAVVPAYWLAGLWLRGFAYKVSVGWLPFAMAMAAVILVTLLTVFVRAARTALANPVDSLRHE